MAPTQALAPRKQPKQARAQATIEAILEATARILVEDGFDAASTNHIARRAGISVGSLYQYFASKEAVIYALVERHIEQMQQQLADIASGMATAPIEDAVRAYVRAMFAVHRVEPRLHRVFFEQLPKLAGRDAFQRWSENSESLVRGYLEGHRDHLRPRDLEMAAFLLVHSVESVSYAVAVLRPRYLERDALAEEVSQLVIRYLRGDPVPERTKPPRRLAAAHPGPKRAGTRRNR